MERLAGIARVLVEAPAAHIVSAIFDGIAEHSWRDRPTDDASVLVVKRHRGAA